MREIKFRFWSKILRNFVVPDDSIYKGAFTDPEMVVMQHTGLKDKNGVEIYEGDILAGASDHIDGENLTIYWSDNLGGWAIFQLNHEEEFLVDHLYETAEVIGNIYENPDLVAGEGA